MSTVPFELLRPGVEKYLLTIVTDPAVPADRWTLSFDKGTTKHPCTSPDGVQSLWLIANSGAVDPDPTAVILAPGTYTPQIECIDDPEVIVRNAPTIVIR